MVLCPTQSAAVRSPTAAKLCGRSANSALRFLGPNFQREAKRVSHLRVQAFAKSAKRAKYSQSGTPTRSEPLFLQVEPDGSDSWRLGRVVDGLKAGQVGILPTDTYPAIVCDIDDRQAVEKLYRIKGLSPKKQLSILCRHMQDISAYTMGFPASNQAGQADLFRLARQNLPGPYTFILTASKQLPKQCTDYQSGKSKQRKSVGVRIPDDTVLQAVLSDLDRPLLCTSAHVEEQEQLEIPEAAMFIDMYSGQGLDFIVDSGQRGRKCILLVLAISALFGIVQCSQWWCMDGFGLSIASAFQERVVQVAEGSTVIDMTGPEPSVVRVGKGDPSVFVSEPAYA